MEIKEIQTFCDEQIKFLEDKYGLEKDKEKDNWAYALKIGEELGELFESLLKAKGYQRPDKMLNPDGKLEEELADVLLTTIILTRSLGFDTEQILKQKINKIKEKNKKWHQ